MTTHEDRPEILTGASYKIKPPLLEAAVYITINNAEVEGKLRPVEVFIHCKDMKSFQWISTCTRLVSDSFWHAKEFPTYTVDILLESCDPAGCYFIKGKKYNSIVHHIGDVIKEHCKSLGIDW